MVLNGLSKEAFAERSTLCTYSPLCGRSDLYVSTKQRQLKTTVPISLSMSVAFKRQLSICHVSPSQHQTSSHGETLFISSTVKVRFIVCSRYTSLHVRWWLTEMKLTEPGRYKVERQWAKHVTPYSDLIQTYHRTLFTALGSQQRRT